MIIVVENFFERSSTLKPTLQKMVFVNQIIFIYFSTKYYAKRCSRFHVRDKFTDNNLKKIIKLDNNIRLN